MNSYNVGYGTVPQTGLPNNTNPNAQLVANSFVLKYYTMLSQSPQSLFHFYKDSSVFTHGHEDSNAGLQEETVTGKESINKKIHSLSYHDCKVSLSVVDSQMSQDGGVLITVIGYMQNKGDIPKKFLQTFFLATQTEPVGFYVKNDIFRFLKDNSASNLHNLPTSTSNPSINTTTNNGTVSPSNSPSVTPSSSNESASNNIAVKEQPQQQSQPSTAVIPSVNASPVVSTTPTSNNVVPQPPTTSATTTATTTTQPVKTADNVASSVNVVPNAQPSTQSQPQQAPNVVPAVVKKDESKTASVTTNQPEKKQSQVGNKSQSNSAKAPAADKLEKESAGENKPQNPNNKSSGKSQPAKSANKEKESESNGAKSVNWATIASTTSEQRGPAPPPQQLLELQKQQQTEKKPESNKRYKDNRERNYNSKTSNQNNSNNANSKAPKEAVNNADSNANNGESKELPYNPANTVYVRNLPYEVLDEEVKAVFEKFGTIVNITLKKGYGFIEYNTPDIPLQLVENAKTTPIVIAGRTINVDERRKPGSGVKQPK